MFCRTKSLSGSWMPLLVAAWLSLSGIASVRANTAVLFGATGDVGNEVLRAILAVSNAKTNDKPFFTKLVLVGRRAFPPKVEDLLTPSPADLPEIVRIEIPNLEHVDQHEALLTHATEDGSDVACFIAVGSGFPHLSDLHDWHSVEVTMAGSMARLCGKAGAASLTTFTSVDVEANPEAFGAEELVPTGVPMGWSRMVLGIMRVLGSKEEAVISNAGASARAAAARVPRVRIFRPSNIITKELRYGWLDWTIFKLHAILDPYIPTRYHSVTAELLATAMVKDAMNVLSGRSVALPESAGGTATEKHGAIRFTYGDFVRIAGENAGTEEMSTEL